MGSSAYAYLVYGVNFSEEDPFDLLSKEKVTPLLNEDETFEDFISCDHYEKMAFFVENDKKLGIIPKDMKDDDYPIRILEHCRGSYPMYILGLKKPFFDPWRGDCYEINPSELVADPKDIEFFQKFCERYMPETYNLSWLLCPYTEE